MNHALWKEVVVSIHNLGNKPATYIAKRVLNGVWCNISKAVHGIAEIGLDHRNLFSLVPGSGIKILFWKDIWCGNSTLQSRFPNLYDLESSKRCRLNDRVSVAGFNGAWKKAPNNTNCLQELLQLYRDIAAIPITPPSPFGFRFTPNEDGRFTVNRMRELVDSASIQYIGPRIRWSKLSPLKVRCFIWRASIGRIPVAETLLSRGVNVQSSNCLLCLNEVESVDHVLTKCNFAKEVRFWVFKWCGVADKQFDNTNELLDYAACWGNCPRKRKIFNAIVDCLLWNIWLVRNDKVFKNTRTAPAKVADNIVSLSYMWCKHRSSHDCGSWINWSISPLSHDSSS